jgi:leucyl/phenylalanyl-tRNA---protein transferase
VKRLRWLAPDDPPDAFPPLHEALDEPAGLLAGGGDLSPQRLLAAYARGIFPWFAPGQPILWWSPDPREVLFPAEFHRSRSLAKTLRSGALRVTRDSAFEQVIAACAERPGGDRSTWITPEMKAAYAQLHRLGRAVSYETWNAAGDLVGGLYGVRTGSVFCGESMFSRATDASKVALARLVQDCPADGIRLIDCQMPSDHLRSLGSRPLPRAQFVALLRSGAVPAP